MKIAISTGGGDCPGLNAAIRAVVLHGKRTYGYDLVGIRNGFNGLLSRPLECSTLEPSNVNDILHRGGTILGTFNQGSPFRDPAKKQSTIIALKEGLKMAGIDGMIVIGGEGTQEMAWELIQENINVIGIPKTIDNDLPGTDQTIGFATATEIVADSVIKLQSTAESHHRVMVLEVMGRDSGYIALHGGLAGGADIILIPEIPFDYKAICAKIQDRQKQGLNYSVLVVAEGATENGKDALFKKSATGSTVLGGIGSQVATTIHKMTTMDTRTTVLGHLQRGGTPCYEDKILASRFGVFAVDMVNRGSWGSYAGLSGQNIIEIPYTADNAGKRQEIEKDYHTLKTAEAIGICLGR